MTDTSTITQSTQIPPYLEAALKDVLGQTQAYFKDTQYQPYTGQRFAGVSPLQQQAIKNLQQFTPAAQLGQATELATQAGLGSLGAGQQYAQQATSPTALQSWMSPYMQGVVEQQKQAAIQDYARQLPQLGLGAAKVGGLGGTRQALVQAEAQRNLQNQLGGIQAQGLQSAYDQAIKNMQFGSNLGMQGYGQALSGAGQLGQLGQTAYGQAMGITGAQMQAGAGLQGQEQAALEAQYQDFLARQQYPQQQLGFYSNIVRGTPYGTTTTSTTQQPSGSTGTQIGGILGALYEAFRK